MRIGMSSVLVLLLATVVQAEKYDLVITNGRIVDGAGNTWFYGDIAVKGDTIAAIGPQGSLEGEKAIDAKNNIVAPGFIDVHTHADSGLHSEPKAKNFIYNGVTTLVVGNCGGSTTKVADYFAKLQSKGIAPNVATLIGHNSVLRAAKGDSGEPMTPEQMEKAKQIVHQAMQDGAVGFSTGLIYTPGKYSDTEELIELQRVAAQFGGIYVSHMRSEGEGILKAIDEAVRIGRETSSRVQISHFKMPRHVAKKLGGADATLGAVMQARSEGIEVWLDQYPYTASSTTITTLLPDWVQAQGRDEMRKILADSEQLERVLTSMRRSISESRGATDLSYVHIASCSAYPHYAGKNVKQITQINKLKAEKGDDVELLGLSEDHWPQVTMEDQFLTVIDICRSGGASCVFHTMDETEVKDIMAHPLVAIASDSGVRTFGEGVPHPRGYGTNSRVLGRYVRELQILTLEDAIRKMTSMPATAFRFSDRGLLREGYKADIVIFDEKTVIDKATFNQPHQYAEGFTHVIVNGKPVLEGGEMTDALPGQVIRRQTQGKN
jgi:N-acyl-D-amino-acid deacylase